ncbi:MAG: hypothetical protein ACP5RJ_06800 [Conexivisphaera sp.]
MPSDETTGIGRKLGGTAATVAAVALESPELVPVVEPVGERVGEEVERAIRSGRLKVHVNSCQVLRNVQLDVMRKGDQDRVREIQDIMRFIGCG